MTNPKEREEESTPINLTSTTPKGASSVVERNKPKQENFASFPNSRTVEKRMRAIKSQSDDTETKLPVQPLIRSSSFTSMDLQPRESYGKISVIKKLGLSEKSLDMP